MLVLWLSHPYLGDDSRSRSSESSWNFVAETEEKEEEGRWQRVDAVVRGKLEREVPSGGGGREEKTGATTRGRTWDAGGGRGGGAGGSERVRSAGEGVPLLEGEEEREEAPQERPQEVSEPEKRKDA